MLASTAAAAAAAASNRPVINHGCHCGDRDRRPRCDGHFAGDLLWLCRLQEAGGLGTELRAPITPSTTHMLPRSRSFLGAGGGSRSTRAAQSVRDSWIFNFGKRRDIQSWTRGTPMQDLRRHAYDGSLLTHTRAVVLNCAASLTRFSPPPTEPTYASMRRPSGLTEEEREVVHCDWQGGWQ